MPTSPTNVRSTSISSGIRDSGTASQIRKANPSVRNPSPAIFVASLCVPFATFYAIVSFLIGNSLAVFIVMTAAYGFSTAAMLIPALFEFDVAMGRTTGSD